MKTIVERQGLYEFAVFLSLVSILLIIGITVMGISLQAVYCSIINDFSASISGCL